MPSYAQFRMSRGLAAAGGAGRAAETFGDQALDVLGDVAEVPLGALATAGDILSRPQMALSEAYGAHVSGEESPLEAGIRGLTEGFEGREYPTFGERIVPIEEGEGLGRQIARLGAEIVTDPLVAFGGPVFKGVGKGAIAGARAVGRTKTAQAFASSDTAQALSRLALPLSKNLEIFGGESGAFVSRGSKLALDEADRLAGQEITSLFETARRAGLMRDPERRKLVKKVIESGQMSGDEAVDALAFHVKQVLDDWGMKVKTFRDADDLGFLVDGKPFEMRANYFPQALRSDILQGSLSDSGMSKQASRLAKQLKITEEEALEILKHQTGRVKRAGHIERPRLKNIPDELLELDPLVVIPRYVRQVSHRMEMARQFGRDYKYLNEALDNAAKAGLSTRTIEQTRNAIQKIHTPSAFGLDELAPKILAFNVMRLMGPTSTIAQLSQGANTVVADGLTSYARGLAKLATDKGVRQRSLDAFNSAYSRMLEHMVGGEASRAQEWASRWLRWSGFTPGEKVNRMTAYAGGVASAEQAATRYLARGGAFPERLAKMGVTPDDLTDFVQRGHRWAPEIERKIGINAANNTQFTTRFTDLPPAWQTPEMRLAMQFRGFIYQQSRFLVREVMQPAIRYIESGGKQGTIAPLARALAMYPVAGHAVAQLREAYAELVANKLGVKRKFKRRLDTKHPLYQMVSDSMYVGSLGMAGDMLSQASRGRLLDWAVGPTATGLAYGGEALVSHTGKMLFEGEYPELQDIVTEGIRGIPGRRAIPLGPSETYEGLTNLAEELF